MPGIQDRDLDPSPELEADVAAMARIPQADIVDNRGRGLLLAASFTGLTLLKAQDRNNRAHVAVRAAFRTSFSSSSSVASAKGNAPLNFDFLMPRTGFCRLATMYLISYLLSIARGGALSSEISLAAKRVR